MQPSSSPPSKPEGSAPHTPSTSVAGYGLITLAALSVAFMAAHPTAGTNDPGELVIRIGHGIPGNNIVHGCLITIALLMATCFLSLRDALGPHRLIVRAGLVALVVGTSGAVAAALVNGFIMPNVAARFLDAGADEVHALRPVLVLAREANATCARLSVVGLSLAAIAWSIRLLGLPGPRRAAGVMGLVCGLAPLALHLEEHLRMNVPGYGLFIQIHAAWAILAGLVLIRWRPRP